MKYEKWWTYLKYSDFGCLIWVLVLSVTFKNEVLVYIINDSNFQDFSTSHKLSMQKLEIVLFTEKPD